jgi:serine/threonine protein kinase
MAEPPTPSDDDRTIVRPSSARGVRDGALGHMLPIGTRLREYEITGLVGEGGFGIVYLAEDVALQRRVAVKEYMPSSMASRVAGSETVIVKSERHRETFAAGLKSFVNEARLLARFDHPALVKVYRFWEENGTAYMAMPYYEGPTLKSALAARPEPPDEATLRALLRPLLDALAVMHAEKCYHRDIAPDNILLTATGPLLLDFGAARRVIGDMTHALTVVLKPGYAPIEQYGDVATMTQGAWTDLYALACVVYFAITGRVPMSSVERLMDDRLEPLSKIAAFRYGERFLSAIDAALAVRPQDRPQTDAAFRELLDEPAAPPTSTFSMPLLDDGPARVVTRGAQTETGGPTQHLPSGGPPLPSQRMPPITLGPPVPPLRTPPITQGPPVPPLRPPAGAPAAAPDPDVTVVATSRTFSPAPSAAWGRATDLRSRGGGLPSTGPTPDSPPTSTESLTPHLGFLEPAPADDAGQPSAPGALPAMPAAPLEALAGGQAVLEDHPAAAVSTPAPRRSRAPLVIAGAVALLLAVVMLAMQFLPARESGTGREQEASRRPAVPGTPVKEATIPSTAPTSTTATASTPSATGAPSTSTPDRAAIATAPSALPPEATASTPAPSAPSTSPASTAPTAIGETATPAPEVTSTRQASPEPGADAGRRDATPSQEAKPRRTTRAEATPGETRPTRARNEPTQAEPPVGKTARTPTLQARCSDILQKASLEQLTAGEKAFLESECR